MYIYKVQNWNPDFYFHALIFYNKLLCFFLVWKIKRRKKKKLKWTLTSMGAMSLCCLLGSNVGPMRGTGACDSNWSSACCHRKGSGFLKIPAGVMTRSNLVDPAGQPVTRARPDAFFFEMWDLKPISIYTLCFQKKKLCFFNMG